jgi:hypothetical protein
MGMCPPDNGSDCLEHRRRMCGLPLRCLDHNELLQPLGKIVLLDAHVAALSMVTNFSLAARHRRWPGFMALMPYVVSGVMPLVTVGSHMMVFLVTVGF